MGYNTEICGLVRVVKIKQEHLFKHKGRKGEHKEHKDEMLTKQYA